MCEPYHSIVQYSDDFDDHDLPFQMDKESRLKSALGKAAKWLRKIGDYFHFSEWGGGHHSAITSKNVRYLPEQTLYEGEWWSRRFHRDNWGQNLQSGAFEAAKTYHEISVIGNMSLFRRFLETSMLNTKHPKGSYVYVERLLEDVLTPKAGNLLLKKFKVIFDALPRYVLRESTPKVQRVQGISMVMGFTRKRGFFLPHFADDDKLWTPSCRVTG